MSSWLITCKTRKKIVLVGDTLTGKSCLIWAFLNEEYKERVMITPTVVHDYLTEVNVDGKIVALQIWDTGGESDNDKLRFFAYPGADMFFICYAVEIPTSLPSIQEKWLPEISEHCPNVPFFVVANKVDKRSHENYDIRGFNWKRGHIKHGVEGKLMADKVNAAGYFECSAKTGEGVKELFQKALKMILKVDDEDKHFVRREYFCVQQ
ncbi:ras-like GTP-binding protein Rho1 [Dinothrombium tinctorium]|uniref:Ras-like GTP-binding protein Rho1 n=1 Tax=Dinothrombium tinctorium TaxID=1965070 RepID=A0A3S3PDB8_9ACAR|nr:ras-like GTP-binding protein Rho1 [Dinothrombium tinctorium]RWS11659.1 ras-like GTP-binding protein Rho1 [Dinothrombium tinctorium]RWS12047.1 ras-like GTP-binding protein Rho1 [Dinothrombium tinctorium]RWS12940.1 ras-like GTP-binding protein Rho1 [Dinothrombium tinctorium]